MVLGPQLESRRRDGDGGRHGNLGQGQAESPSISPAEDGPGQIGVPWPPDKRWMTIKDVSRNERRVLTNADRS